MKITKFETLLANAGLRNYLFVRLTTDNGISGIGEATLEWQELAVQTLCHEWVEGRVVGRDPFDVEAIAGGMVRDQYQGGATIMTAISGVEIALWDIIGKACRQPVYRLLGGRCHANMAAYANGWYGAAETPQDFADRARDVVSRGYSALKFDPFGTAWKTLESGQADRAVDTVAAVRDAVGRGVDLIIEFHGRLSASTASAILRRLEPFDLLWCEEPVTPDSLDLLLEVKQSTHVPIAAGERLYTQAAFHRLTRLRAVDIVQMDVAHCGGILASKKIAAMAAAQDLSFAPHCSIGPVALAASLHVDWSSPNCLIQESFSEFDVQWRADLVRGWDPLKQGTFSLPEDPGLGLELDDDAIQDHPYRADAFPSLWDGDWMPNFTQNHRTETAPVPHSEPDR